MNSGIGHKKSLKAEVSVFMNPAVYGYKYYTQTDEITERGTHRHTENTDIQTYRHTDIQIYGHTDIQSSTV